MSVSEGQERRDTQREGEGEGEGEGGKVIVTRYEKAKGNSSRKEEEGKVKGGQKEMKSTILRQRNEI